MSQVTVTINGRQFRMACEDGQEGHLMNLARDLDTRIEGLRKNFGEIGDTRLTVMHDARMTAADRTKTEQAAVAAALTAAAERIESVTKKLNAITGGGVALG